MRHVIIIDRSGNLVLWPTTDIPVWMNEGTQVDGHDVRPVGEIPDAEGNPPPMARVTTYEHDGEIAIVVERP